MFHGSVISASQRASSGNRSLHCAKTYWASGTPSHNSLPKSSAKCSSQMISPLKTPCLATDWEDQRNHFDLPRIGPKFAPVTSEGASLSVLQPFRDTTSSLQRADTSRAQSQNFRPLDTSEEPLPHTRHQAKKAQCMLRARIARLDFNISPRCFWVGRIKSQVLSWIECFLGRQFATRGKERSEALRNVAQKLLIMCSGTELLFERQLRRSVGSWSFADSLPRDRAETYRSQNLRAQDGGLQSACSAVRISSAMQCRRASAPGHLTHVA